MPTPKLQIHDGIIKIRFEEVEVAMSVQEALEFCSSLSTCAKEEQKKTKEKTVERIYASFHGRSGIFCFSDGQ